MKRKVKTWVCAICGAERGCRHQQEASYTRISKFDYTMAQRAMNNALPLNPMLKKE